MTIDEAIKICEEDAERIGGNPQSDHHAERCRQLVKWLTELKEAKRLLKQVCCDFSNDKAVRLDHLNEALQFLKDDDME